MNFEEKINVADEIVLKGCDNKVVHFNGKQTLRAIKSFMLKNDIRICYFSLNSANKNKWKHQTGRAFRYLVVENKKSWFIGPVYSSMKINKGFNHWLGQNTDSIKNTINYVNSHYN